MSASNSYLTLPLNGVRLIEASAGTGKTFTLATLVTRLVVEQKLKIGEVLTVTFTDAATQELRKRIRERLQLACTVFDSAPDEDPNSELGLCRQIINAHLEKQEENADALQRRLQQAVLETDLAAIFTIHGFCTRVLREYALEAGAGLEVNALLTNTRALHAQLAADLWRGLAQQDAGADDLLALWGKPEALAKDVGLLCSPLPLLPPIQEEVETDTAQSWLEVAATALRQSWQMHGAVFFSALAQAVEEGVLNKSQYKLDWLVDLKGWFEVFLDTKNPRMTPHIKLEKLTSTALEKGTKKDFKNKTPTSPISREIDAYLQAQEALEVVLVQRRANMLHQIRDELRSRMMQLKQQQAVMTYDDLIDGVADALADARGGSAAALVHSLRGQYAIALVDEFQDTDARQWSIFERVFGEPSGAPALFLIGDPKQAIYSFRGGDVHTYLAAAKTAEHAPELRQNFRSRPAVLHAIAALYKNSAAPFVDVNIKFIDVEAGGKRSNDAYLRKGKSAPALTLWQMPNNRETEKPWSAEASRTQAASACAAAIHAALTDARAEQAQIDGVLLRPGDIAVLVRTHKEAMLIQQALAELGITAVAAGKQSLFETEEARELHSLLLALLQVSDDGRLRAALATVLLGLDAQAVAALDTEGTALHAWQQQQMVWRERLQRGGPLTLINTLCAEHGQRLLGLQDGERRLSNYLQLAEALQEMQANTLGLHGLVDWLAQMIASADRSDETQLLRLESDACRVQIVTLHKSKGLEYSLVFLPFVGIRGKAPTPGKYCVAYSETQGPCLHWKLDLPAAGWEVAKQAWEAEQLAEDARLLYVGLTRARHALWLAYGELCGYRNTALARLLANVEAWSKENAIVIDTTPTDEKPARLLPEVEADPPPAREATHTPRSDWWVYSFSQLSNSEAGGEAQTRSVATVPASSGRDEVEGEPSAISDLRFSGNRFGVALHAAFEHTDFSTWRAWCMHDPAPAAQTGIIAKALHDEGYASELVDDGVALCTRLIGHTLTARLPEGLRLCDLEASEHRAEIEFQFALQPTRIDALLALLHSHGVALGRDRFDLRNQLEGLMTGLIDLTYRHAEKWYVLDYKSNRLPAYDSAAMDAAMAHSEYDLQALIYTLALHRWLRFRLGDNYDYARDFGGIRYLFCRGIDASENNGHGIYAARFAAEFIDQLDALFGCTGEGVAA